MKFVFYNDTATTEIYTLSLHDALPIFERREADELSGLHGGSEVGRGRANGLEGHGDRGPSERSEEHTSELQSRQYLVCRLLLEKKHSTYRPRARHRTCITSIHATQSYY